MHTNAAHAPLLAFHFLEEKNFEGWIIHLLVLYKCCWVAAGCKGSRVFKTLNPKTY